MSQSTAKEIGKYAADKVKKPELYLHFTVFLEKKDQVINDETFRVESFNGQESVSQPFEFQLTLHGNDDSKAKHVDFSQVIGRPITVGINLPVEKTIDSFLEFQKSLKGEASGEFSLFNGMVTSFSMKERGVYQLSMKPALWRMSLTNAYKVHSQMSVRQVIEGLMSKHRLNYNTEALKGDKNAASTRVQDWLQTGESDLDLLQRLMAKCHIYYYFVHTATSHQIVFANTPHYPKVFDDDRPLRYTYTQTEALGLEQEDVISDFDYDLSLTSTGVKAVLTRQQEAWEKDTVADYQVYEHSSGKKDEKTHVVDVGDLPFHLYRIYQYGGSTEEIKQYANSEFASMNTSSTTFSGSSGCSQLRSGYQFKVDSQSSYGDTIRDSLKNKTFVLNQVQHQASLDGNYKNQFKATESDGLIAQFSLQNTHQGNLLAKVVSGGNGTAPNDWRYYEKSVFDPEQKTDTDSQATPKTLNAKGVYVEFSSDGLTSDPVWVKLAPHMQTVPEIGVTVIVTRANDDSELPEIQSIVQNNGTQVVTPSGWTANTHVGSSYSTSYGDSKSVRYGKDSKTDLKAAVKIVEDEYAKGDVKDSAYSKGASFSYSTSETGKSGLLSRSKSFGSNYSHHEGAKSISYAEIDYSKSTQVMVNSDNYSTISKKSYSESTIGTQESHSTVTGDSHNYSDIGGLSYNKSSSDTSESYSTTTGKNYSKQEMGSMESHTKINGKSDSYHNQSGKSYSNTTITGDQENISKVTGTAKTDSTTGISNNTSKTGIQSTSSLVGISNNNSMIGVSNSNSLMVGSVDVSIAATTNRMNITGANTSMSVAGVNTDISVAASTNSVSIKGTIATVEVVAGGIEFKTDPALVKTEMIGPDISLLSAIKLIL